MLLDPEISLLPIVQDPEASTISEKHLANSLPPHDQYLECLKGLFEHISAENTESVFHSAPSILLFASLFVFSPAFYMRTSYP